ncbi:MULTISPECIES: hypothetical protein [Nostocales]|uniref:hypothetical protein n=1 Tax=Nostocales TaxID=1161 RepID=UPI0016894DB3|nr:MULTISPECIES: hypothetical protein [Nostocales]MBD2486735.1 hypothetical protein [Aulosira sp. FACHB-615]
MTSVSKKFRVEFAYFEGIVIIAGFGAIALAYLGHCNYRWIWSDRTHQSGKNCSWFLFPALP